MKTLQTRDRLLVRATTARYGRDDEEPSWVFFVATGTTGEVTDLTPHQFSSNPPTLTVTWHAAVVRDTVAKTFTVEDEWSEDKVSPDHVEFVRVEFAGQEE